MGKSKFLTVVLIISTLLSNYQLFAQNISTSVLHSDNYERDTLMMEGSTLLGTDHYKFQEMDDTKNYHYSSYQITTNLHEVGLGEVIEINNKKNRNTFILGEGSGSFFKGIIDHYMIISRDQCTGDYLQIFDLNTQEVIFNSFYEGGLRVIDDKVYFKENVQIKEDAKKPECSQEMIDKGYSIGYVEKLIYDLNKKELSRTGVYECSYHMY